MTLGGLFSGIGGFELAAKRAGITPVWSNEIDPFCCKVLRKNFSYEIIEADIRTIGKEREHELQPVDIICGGFPCQPFSTAGQRKGKDDNRYLWPEMLRTIREVKPSWVVGENVAGILSMDDGAVFDQIYTSLEDEGYQVETYNIPACGIGAPHRRERIWIVAHANDILQRRQAERRELPGEAKATEGTEQREGWNELLWEWCGAMLGNGFEDCFSTDATSQRSRKEGINSERSTQRTASGNTALANPDSAGLSIAVRGEQRSVPETNGASSRRELGRTLPTAEQWEEHWFSFATWLCRMDDGVSSRVDRSNRLKSLGNAIVPHLAQVLFGAILQFENNLK